MATLTIRDLDDALKRSLRVRAASRNRSMEEEARQILRAALLDAPAPAGDLGSRIRARFAALGGIDLPLAVLSELLRARPHEAVLAWFAVRPADSLFVSAVTQAEMLLGARLLPAGKHRSQLEQALDAMFQEDFAGRVVPFDFTAAPAYAAVVSARRAGGRPISQFDARIAAIATSRRFAVATRNVSYFEGCGLVVENPWLSPRAGIPPSA